MRSKEVRVRKGRRGERKEGERTGGGKGEGLRGEGWEGMERIGKGRGEVGNTHEILATDHAECSLS